LILVKFIYQFSALIVINSSLFAELTFKPRRLLTFTSQNLTYTAQSKRCNYENIRKILVFYYLITRQSKAIYCYVYQQSTL